MRGGRFFAAERRSGVFFSREIPGAAFGVVFGFGEEDVDGVFCRVNACDEGLEVALVHRGAAKSGGFSPATPDVEKDRGAGVGDGTGGSVVRYKELERMRMVALLHLSIALEGAAGLVRDDKVLVVVRRSRVLDPKVTAGDAAVGELRVAGDIFGVTKSRPDSENSRRGASIPFFFQPGTRRIAVQTATPGKSVFAEARADRSHALLPTVANTIVEREVGVGGVPTASDANQDLIGATGAGGSRQKAENEEKKKASHKNLVGNG